MRVLSALLLVALAVPAAAQEQEIRNANLSRQLEWELLRMYDGGARRIEGDATITASEVVREDVAGLDGTLRVAGRIEGDVAMVNGDVILDPGGSITGSVTVVGGEVRVADEAEVGGTITAYATAREARQDRRRGIDDEDDHRDHWWERREDRPWGEGYSNLTVRTGASYNRVEGLPIMFGPVLRTSGSNPLRVEALAIYRTESGASLATDRMGYRATLEQFLGGEGRFSVGGSVYSVVEPMDRWQISDLEASLAAALFHDDYRDHYDRTGWSAFMEANPVRPLTARVEYRREEFESLAAGDPWSLFDGGDQWRPQPLVAEGDLGSVIGSLELDFRDHDRRPRDGWYGRVAVERPVDGSLTRPGLSVLLPQATPVPFPDPIPSTLPASEVDTDFTTGFVDIRRYTPVGWASQLNLRVVAGGNLAEAPLPPQYQHALGGIGSLPGFDTFYADCGARGVLGSSDEQQFFLGYGCDRFAMAQVEYRGDLSLGFGFGDPDRDDDDDWDWWDDVEIDLDPTWVVFFDAGRGWAYDDGIFGADRDTGTLYDVGVGFLIDELGFYAALPLNSEVDQEPRFFIRLGRRF
jgi:hypothetical protein